MTHLEDVCDSGLPNFAYVPAKWVLLFIEKIANILCVFRMKNESAAKRNRGLLPQIESRLILYIYGAYYLINI
jgi:hypothetical protein